MKNIQLMNNIIQDYAWGSKTSIAEMLGESSPSAEPQAEVWMGAHPKAPSTVGDQSLLDVINEAPAETLGAAIAAKYNNRLPFLFKLLAAGTPLSIQSHPSLEQAKEGFARENAAGIPLDAPHRNYKDDNHKPEILCALTDFWVLNGFRQIPEMLKLLQESGLDEIAPELKQFATSADQAGLRHFFKALLELPADRREKLLNQLVATATAKRDEKAEYDWVCRITDQYPGDIGVMCVLLLNLALMKPGEAMFCAAGDLHAYLDGFGVELMANSDNVLRGGLTPKHVDTPELMSTLTFRTSSPEMLHPVGGQYKVPVEEFCLTTINLDADTRYISDKEHNAEILLVTQGKAIVQPTAGGELLELKQGQSAFIPAAAGEYEVQGNGTIYKASVRS